MIDFVTESGKGLIHLAAHNSNPIYIQELLKAGIDINTPTKLGRTPLIYAAAEGKKEIVEFLCSAGADASIRDNGNPSKGTPPMTAEEHASSEEIKAILRDCGGSKKGGRRQTKRRARRRTNTKRVKKLKRGLA